LLMVLLGACVFDLTFLLGARAEFDESRVRSKEFKTAPALIYSKF
jgi:hypothetical protein